MVEHKFKVFGTPVGAPRMTRSDVWKKRECVIKYRAWADTIRKEITGDSTKKLDAEDTIGVYMIFHLPVMDSTRESTRETMYGNYHRVRPDIDNLTKAVLDALFLKDSLISIIHCQKRYVLRDEQPSLEISLIRH